MTIAGAEQTITYTCPQCGWSGVFDSRFVAWCRQYDHGLISPDELRKYQEEKPRQRRQREAARKRAEDMAVQLTQAPDLRPENTARLAALGFGLLVHGVTLLILWFSLLAFTTDNPFAWIVGLMGLGLVWLLRPRFGKRPKEGWLRRNDAPAMFAILDKTAAAIGAPVPTHVTVDQRFNAGTGRLGPLQEPILTIGAPLWQALDRDERLALLGHELGHQVNGDTTRGLITRTARRSLQEWRIVLFPDFRGASPQIRGAAGLAQLLVPFVLLPFYLAVVGLEHFFAWLQVHVSLRAEFLADEMAARVASTESAVRLLRKLSAGTSVEVIVRRTKAARAKEQRTSGRPTAHDGARMWTDLALYLPTVPEHEYLRQEKISEFRGTAADSSHPANYLRQRVLTSRPPHQAAVSISADEWSAAERELGPLLAEAGRQLLR